MDRAFKFMLNLFVSTSCRKQNEDEKIGIAFTYERFLEKCDKENK